MTTRAEYATIPKSVPDGPEYQRLPAYARLVYLTLCLTFSGVGIEVRYPDALVAELVAQTGLSHDDTKAALIALEQHGFLRREANVAWLPRRLRESGLALDNKAKHVPHVRRTVLGLPKIEIVARFVHEYRTWFVSGDQDDELVTDFEWVGIAYPIGNREDSSRPSIAYRNATHSMSQEVPKRFPSQARPKRLDERAELLCVVLFGEGLRDYGRDQLEGEVDRLVRDGVIPDRAAFMADLHRIPLNELRGIKKRHYAKKLILDWLSAATAKEAAS